MSDETRERLKRVAGKLREHRYVALVLLLGLVLLLLPTGGGGEEQEDAPEPEPTGAGEDLEARLEEVLSLIDGAGQVRVLLTLDSDGEHVLARDTERENETRDGEQRNADSDSNLVVSKSGGGSEPVEVAYLYPRYRGAVVAAEGAGSAAVRLALLNAVKAATGLSADAIEIVKMG